jgi:hypothetical protein
MCSRICFENIENEVKNWAAIDIILLYEKLLYLENKDFPVHFI